MVVLVVESSRSEHSLNVEGEQKTVAIWSSVYLGLIYEFRGYKFSFNLVKHLLVTLPFAGN